MKGIARFAEYGVTGGLFWLLVFIYLSIKASDFSMLAVFEYWVDSVNKINSNFSVAGTTDGMHLLDQSSLSGLLSTLCIILVFCTGLLLDLIAPLLCGTFELIYVKRKLREHRKKKQNDNEAWLCDLLSSHKAFLGDSFGQLVDSRLRNWFSLGILVQWFKKGQRRNWVRPQAWANWLLNSNWNKDRRAYLCLRNFLFGYLYVHSAESVQAPLMDKARIWRASRSTAMAFIIFAALIAFTEMQTAETQLAAAVLTPLAILIFSIGLSVTTFSRLFTSMLSHVYHTHQAEPKQENIKVEELLLPILRAAQTSKPPQENE